MTKAPNKGQLSTLELLRFMVNSSYKNRKQRRGHMRMQPEFIESTAGQIAAELMRRGISSDQRVMINIEPDNWLSEDRKFARKQVQAEGIRLLIPQHSETLKFTNQCRWCRV